jgi:predicted DsbA family dithiol-disulfide isomerase
VKDSLGPRLAINWRYFSLEQVNNQQGPQWKLWEQPEGYASRGLEAFWAAEAARCQGEAAFQRFHIALLRARHEQRQDIADVSTLARVAESVGLEMAQFQKDLADRRLLAKLAEDHTFAVESLGVFGTPTIVFPESQAIFLKMSPPLAQEESLSVFTELHHLADRRRYIQEVKRPQRVRA